MVSRCLGILVFEERIEFHQAASGGEGGRLVEHLLMFLRLWVASALKYL